MSFELVKNYLIERGYGDRAQEFTVSSATVELAAAALGVRVPALPRPCPSRHRRGLYSLWAAGDAKVDNHKYKEKFHTKAKMLTPEEAVELVGHAVGGVCPVLCQGRGQGVSGPVAAAVRYCLSGLRQPQQRSQAHSGGAGTALGRRMV